LFKIHQTRVYLVSMLLTKQNKTNVRLMTQSPTRFEATVLTRVRLRFVVINHSVADEQFIATHCILKCVILFIC